MRRREMGVGDEEKIRWLSRNENDHLQKKEEKKDTDGNERGKTEVEIKICGFEMVRTKTQNRTEEQKRGSQWEERVGYESSLLQ